MSCHIIQGSKNKAEEVMEDSEPIECYKCLGTKMGKRGYPCRKCDGTGEIRSKFVKEMVQVMREDI